MKIRTPFAVAAILAAVAAPGFAKEIKGAAILDHACGKVSVQNMKLVHDGKMAEAVKLGTKEMQDQWNAMPASDREMMSGMMKEMSVTGEQFSADIKAGGVLAVEGEDATLTVKQEKKDENGSSTSTMTQRFKVAGATCAISH